MREVSHACMSLSLSLFFTDKIAKWNVVGIQGALLSHFMDPIYLHSITLGSLFHPNHMFRAVAGRMQNTIDGLQEPYRLNVPRLNLVSSPEVRHPGKAPNYSVNWTLGRENKLEVIDAMKGKEQVIHAKKKEKKENLSFLHLMVAIGNFCYHSSFGMAGVETLLS